MTFRQTFPRSANHHEAAAGMVLERYALQSGWKPALPVPVDRIVEHLGLIILCEELDEPPDAQILGALDPTTGIIRLNQRHMELFDTVIGPEQFTLAHELGTHRGFD